MVDILFLTGSKTNLVKSFGIQFFLTYSKSQPVLAMNFNIAFSDATESSQSPVVLHEMVSLSNSNVSGLWQN